MINNFTIKCSKKGLVKYLKEASLIVRKNDLSLLEIWDHDIFLKTISDYGKSGGVGCIFKSKPEFYGKGTGTCLIDIKQLLAMVKCCLSDSIELRYNDLHDAIEVISCEDACTSMLNVTYDEYTISRFSRNYPVDIKEKATEWIRFNNADFQEIIKKVSTACAKKDLYGEYNTMGGIYFNKVGDKLDIVATDGRVLSICSVNANDYNMSSGDFKRLITGNQTNVLLKKLKQKSDKEDYIICFHNDKALISTGKTYIISYIVDWEYPNYNKVLNHVDWDGAHVKINKQKTMEAIEKIAPGCDHYNKIRVEITKDKMLLSSTTPTDKDNENILKSEVAIDNTLEGYVFGINYNFFLDALKTQSGESLSMYIDIYEDENKKKYNGNPIGFKSDNSYNAIYLVMPTKLREEWGGDDV